MTDEFDAAMLRKQLRIDSLEDEVLGLREEVQGLRSDVQDLVEAWNTARGVVKFVRLIGTISIALTALFALLKLSGTKP